ncbi:MAG TPA: hypothetical protein VGM81_04055 [Burkholderiaceae bacterium]|jgi:hypothetical protein
MDFKTVPQKTERARELLARSRQSLPAAQRMLLITIDGRKEFAALRVIARSMGLDDKAFEWMRDEGLITWPGMLSAADLALQAEQTAAAQRQERLRGLVRAKMYALDLATLMLAGKEGGLRERAREVDSESRFHAWVDECAATIGSVAGAERADLFRARVTATS